MDTQFNPGDVVRVEIRATSDGTKKGKGKEKASAFEGVVIAMRGRGENKMFTVRRIGAGGVGVERIFPLYSPNIEKITVKRRGDVRRAKLYYLRNRIGRNQLLT